MTIQLNGSVNITNGNLRSVMSLAETLTTTGSNNISNAQNVVTGSWQVIDQGSLSDFRLGVFQNTNATSSIYIAINSAGTSSYAALLWPGDSAILTNSGSCILFAKASGAAGTAVLQYMLSEN